MIRIPVARFGRSNACYIRAEAGCAPALQPTPDTIRALGTQKPCRAAKIIVCVLDKEVEDGCYIGGLNFFEVGGQCWDRLRVLKVVFWGLHIAGTLSRCSGKVVDLVLKAVRLECNGGDNCGLLPRGSDIVGCERGADGLNSLGSGAAFRGKGSGGARGRFRCYRDKLGLAESRNGGIADSRQSESGGDEQRQRWGYEMREHGVSFGVEVVNG